MKLIPKIHHYMGTFFFGMFVIWFLSGFVMMYKSFPFLSEKVRIKGSECVQSTTKDLPHPAEIYSDYKDGSCKSLRVNSVLGEPAYHLITEDGTLRSRFAFSGKAVAINEQLALQIAKSFTGTTSLAEVKVLQAVDQWIPRPKYASHLPVYKVCFDDDAGTFVHISSKTGEVISCTSRSDRTWAWLGAIPHWIYLKEIRMHKTFWSQLCIWLSAFGFIMSLSGIITGIIRFKRKNKVKFRRFKNKWYNIHYYTGLSFGLFVCTWIFSGFMSMSPFNWSYDFRLSEEEIILWESRSNSLVDISDKEWKMLQHTFRTGQLKEARFSLFAGRLFATLTTNDTTKSVCLTDAVYRPAKSDLAAQLQLLNPADSVLSVELLSEYDNYYYDRDNSKTLPVLKVATAHPLDYYIHPANGQVLLKSDRNNKIERWLYHGLHSLDFSFLSNKRPLWDIVMIVLLLGGTSICITATGLGIKFIRRKRRKHIKRKARLASN